jgi:hypothetical protein
MTEPVDRKPEDIKADVLRVLEIYRKHFADKNNGIPFFDGYRAALAAVEEDVQKIKTKL